MPGATRREGCSNINSIPCIRLLSASGVPMSTYGYIAVTLLVVVVVIVSIVACKIKRGNCKKQPTGGDFNNPLESAYDNKV